jgi:hypothetical protein
MLEPLARRGSLSARLLGAASFVGVALVLALPVRADEVTFNDLTDTVRVHRIRVFSHNR